MICMEIYFIMMNVNNRTLNKKYPGVLSTQHYITLLDL